MPDDDEDDEDDGGRCTYQSSRENRRAEVRILKLGVPYGANWSFQICDGDDGAETRP